MAATSSGVPIRRIGTSAAYPEVSRPSCRSTGIQPGWTRLTVMLSGPSSLAQTLVNPTWADLAAT